MEKRFTIRELFWGFSKLFIVNFRSYLTRIQILLTLFCPLLAYSIPNVKIHFFYSLFCPKFLLILVNINPDSIYKPLLAVVLNVTIISLLALYGALRRAVQYSRLLTGTYYGPDEYKV